MIFFATHYGLQSPDNHEALLETEILKYDLKAIFITTEVGLPELNVDMIVTVEGYGCLVT